MKQSEDRQKESHCNAQTHHDVHLLVIEAMRNFKYSEQRQFLLFFIFLANLSAAENK